MKKSYILITIIGIIALIAIFTNPSTDEHKEAMKNKLNTLMQKNLNKESNENNSDFESAVQTFAFMLGGTVINGLIDNTVSRDNYILFSTTKMTFNGKTKVVGIGAFGNVFITNKIDKAIEEKLQNKEEFN